MLRKLGLCDDTGVLPLFDDQAFVCELPYRVPSGLAVPLRQKQADLLPYAPVPAQRVERFVRAVAADAMPCVTSSTSFPKSPSFLKVSP